MKNIENILKLEPGEEVIEVLRHYLLVMLPGLIISLLILLLDFFLMVYLFSLGLFGVIFFIFVIAAIAFYSGRLFFLWSHNFIVLTNKRILDFERSGFFDELRSEFPYFKIKNVSLHSKGLWQSLFKYGDLRLSIVNEPLVFEFYNIKNPARVLELINRQLVTESNRVLSEEARHLSRLTNEIRSLPPEVQAELREELLRNSGGNTFVEKEVS